MELHNQTQDHPLTLVELLAELPEVGAESDESLSRTPTNLPDGQTNMDD